MLREVWHEAARRGRVAVTRALAEHPGGRPDGKTLAAALALVVVVVVSATIVAPRPAASAPRAATVIEAR
jgi:hypothetical protein